MNTQQDKDHPLLQNIDPLQNEKNGNNIFKFQLRIFSLWLRK